MTTLTSLSSSIAAHPFGNGDGPGPWFLLFPLTFWVLIAVTVVLVARNRRRRPGEATLADAFARGDITEAEYRSRLAVLRETRR